MDDGRRYVLALLVAAAIVALIVFARGASERDLPDESPPAAVVGAL